MLGIQIYISAIQIATLATSSAIDLLILVILLEIQPSNMQTTLNRESQPRCLTSANLKIGGSLPQGAICFVAGGHYSGLIGLSAP